MKRSALLSLLVALMLLGTLIGGATAHSASASGCCQPTVCCCPPCYFPIVIDDFGSIFGPLCGVPGAPTATVCTPAGAVRISLIAGEGGNLYYVSGTLIYLAPGEIELDLTGLCRCARRVEVVIEETAEPGSTVVTALDGSGNVIAQASSTTCVEEVLTVDLCGSGYCGIAKVKIKAERAFIKEIKIWL